jgi:predicted RNase H-like HicB family nuclease
VLVVAHYISIVMPLSAGGWRAMFPDIPDCAVEGDSLDIAVLRAAGALSARVDLLCSDGRNVPTPRSLSEIKADDGWAVAHHVDWTKAVVTMVPFRGNYEARH